MRCALSPVATLLLAPLVALHAAHDPGQRPNIIFMPALSAVGDVVRRDQSLDLTRAATGSLELDLDGAKPDGRGVLADRSLVLPAFDEAILYAADWWPGGGNRLYPRFFGSGVPQSAWTGGALLLLRLKDGDYLAMLPVAGDQTSAWIDATDGGAFTLRVGHLGRAPGSGAALAFAWSRAPDAYAALRDVWSQVLLHPRFAGTSRLRSTKGYPQAFRYLGWCSWESFHLSINEAALQKTVQAISDSPIPVRWALIDDGHQNVRNIRELYLNHLLDFDPIREKFPGGFASLLALRNPERIRWIGLWLSFLGGRDGVAQDHRLSPELAAAMTRVHSGGLLPGASPSSALEFYSHYLDQGARRHGFDFVKVDFQSRALTLYAGGERANVPIAAGNRHAIANPVAAAVCAVRGLEQAAAARGMPMMNCNSLNAPCVFNTGFSAVSRCSEDYVVGHLGRARTHLFYSFASIPWLGQTVWGDHDMFHSEDAVSGAVMARSKAVSGGPVYLSDLPERFVSDHIMPLCYSDGELLRPLAPAAPAPDSLFLDPLAQARPLKVLAPLPNDAVAVIVYNLYAEGAWSPALVSALQRGGVSSEIQAAARALVEGRALHEEVLSGQLRDLFQGQKFGGSLRDFSSLVHAGAKTVPMTASVTAQDFSDASVMMQPYPGPWPVPAEGLVWFERETGAGGRLGASLALDLPGFGDRMVQLSAIRDGWAIIGDRSKYLSAAAVQMTRRSADALEFEVRDGGRFVVWHDGAIRCTTHSLRSMPDHFWEVAVPETKGCQRVVLARGSTQTPSSAPVKNQ